MVPVASVAAKFAGRRRRSEPFAHVLASGFPFHLTPNGPGRHGAGGQWQRQRQQRCRKLGERTAERLRTRHQRHRELAEGREGGEAERPIRRLSYR